ncbi:hypothetical protein QVD99_000064, partial [Batrachochytrium dendrobatidis]
LSHNKVVLSEAGALFPIRSPTHPPTEKGTLETPTVLMTFGSPSKSESSTGSLLDST